MSRVIILAAVNSVSDITLILYTAEINIADCNLTASLSHYCGAGAECTIERRRAEGWGEVDTLAARSHRRAFITSDAWCVKNCVDSYLGISCHIWNTRTKQRETLTLGKYKAI